MEPDRVRERWLELQDGTALAELRARCEAAAVEEREVPFNWWAYAPRPFPREMAGEDPRRGRSREDARLGLDAAGRPTFQRLRDNLFQLYDWHDDVCDVFEVNGEPRKLERYVFVDGILVEEVSADGVERLDGRPRVEVSRWSYEDDRPTLVLTTYESGSHRSWGGPERVPHWRAKAHTFSYDEAGALTAITTWLGTREFADDAGADEAQSAARAAFPQDFNSRPLYDARTQRREIDLPSPDRVYEGLAEPLSDEFFAAIERERGALGPLEFVLAVVGGTYSRVIAADATFVQRARQMAGGSLREMLLVAYEAPAGTVSVDVADAASPEVLRGLRAGEQALAEQYGSRRQAEFLREVLAELNARDWPEVAPTFVVVNLPEEDSRHWVDYDEDDDYDDADDEDDEDDEFDFGRWQRTSLPELESIVGRARVDAFLHRMEGGRKSRVARGDLRPGSRAELADLLVDSGVAPDEASRVADDALWGIVLEPGGTGVSRLGGAPVLPADTPWPRADDRPLTHLATIALDELPAVEGREHLPDDGVLSFFVDTTEEGDFVEPIEPEDDSGHELVAIIHTPAGAPTHEPEPPGEYLDEQRVVLDGRLQLRHLGFGSGQRRFGIDALAEKAVERLTDRVNGRSRHQLLGYPWPVQDDPREPGQIVLFHIGDDPEIGFSFIDAGDIHFLGTPDDIKHCRWDKLTVYPNSC